MRQAPCSFLFLTHGSPDIGGHQVRTAHCFTRITHDLHALTTQRHEAWIGVVALGAGDAQLEIELQGRLDVGVAHVEAVADPGHGLALNSATVFLERLHVGQQLARVRFVGQAVDHRHPRMCGEFGQGAVGMGTDHYRIEHARHDDGAVADRFAAAQLGVAWRQEDGLAAELDHAGLERHAGTGRGLLEDHAQHAVLQGLEQHASLAQVLQLDAAADHPEQFVGGEVQQGEKVPSAHD
ncbi:hypothetical protein D3C81_747500 [compost metagenome]